jgi:hypothetical protein
MLFGGKCERGKKKRKLKEKGEKTVHKREKLI